MDFLITGLDARIWSQLGGRLGRLKCSQKQEKPWFFSAFGLILVISFGVASGQALGRPRGPAGDPLFCPRFIVFSPFHFLGVLG